jgi:two-component system KDP operon response regulator KdpE
MARILFVDDDPLTLETYSHLIGFYGHEALLAGTAEQAILTAFDELPDIMVLDLNLPDLHGFDLLLRLRNNAKTADIPVIMISASPDTIADRALQLGAQKYISKPVHPDELLTIIDQYTANDA